MPNNFREVIETNIRVHGFHITFVKAGVVPRFAYTIGLSRDSRDELLIAGASYFSEKRLLSILEVFGRSRSEATSRLAAVGKFRTQPVDESWKKLLMLGANDVLEGRFGATQIILEEMDRVTVDTPNASVCWSIETSGPWRWLQEPWTFPVPPKSVAITNLNALRGESVTEASRWGNDEWHLFAGNGPEIDKKDVRIVPLATMLACDYSLCSVVELGVGDSIWRQGPNSQWHEWGKRTPK